MKILFSKVFEFLVITITVENYRNINSKSTNTSMKYFMSIYNNIICVLFSNFNNFMPNKMVEFKYKFDSINHNLTEVCNNK